MRKQVWQILQVGYIYSPTTCKIRVKELNSNFISGLGRHLEVEIDIPPVRTRQTVHKMSERLQTGSLCLRNTTRRTMVTIDRWPHFRAETPLVAKLNIPPLRTVKICRQLLNSACYTRNVHWKLVRNRGREIEWWRQFRSATSCNASNHVKHVSGKFKIEIKSEMVTGRG